MRHCDRRPDFSPLADEEAVEDEFLLRAIDWFTWQVYRGLHWFWKLLQ